MCKFKTTVWAAITLLVLGLAAPAAAQSAISAYVSAAGNGKTLVGAANPMPVSGRSAIFAVSPAVTAASAYATGNVVGPLMTFAGIASDDNPTGLIQAIGFHFKSAQTADMDFVFCSQNPSSTTVTDKTAVALNVADFAKCRAYRLSGANCISLGTPTYCEIANLASPFTIPTGTDAYGFLVTRGTPTFTSTSDVTVSLRVVR